MSTGGDIKRGQVWRRVKDGTLVEIDEVTYASGGYAAYVAWRAKDVARSRRRECNGWDFERLYERVDGGDGR